MKKHCDIEECNGINAGIDPCIQQMVKALNDGGIETICSCCGHGNTIGSIVLKDRRELMIAPDFSTAREMEQYFPDIHGDWMPHKAQGKLNAIQDFIPKIRHAALLIQEGEDGGAALMRVAEKLTAILNVERILPEGLEAAEQIGVR